MSTKKPKEPNGAAPEKKPPAADGKDPFTEAAAKLATMGEPGENIKVGDTTEGVKVTDAGPASPLEDFVARGQAAQAEVDKIIHYTKGDEKTHGEPTIVSDEDPEALFWWFSDLVPRAAAKLNKHRDYFMGRKIDGKTINPYGPALHALVRSYDRFNELAGMKGIKTE